MAPPFLQSPRWNPPTRDALNAALDRQRREKHRQAAIFDFDNTCIFHDFGEAVFREQLQRHRFALSPDVFDRLLPRAVGDQTRLSTGEDLSELSAQLSDLYARLERSAFVDPTPDTTVARREFSSRLAALYVGLEMTPGIGARFAYPWVCGLLGGFSDDEVASLALDAWNASVTEPIGWTTFSAGGISPTTMRTGVRAISEIRELIDALNAVGVECFIVTASEQTLIRTVAPSIGLAVPPDNIFGMRLEKDAQGKRGTTLANGAIPTYREGKRATIEREILPRGVAPLLVAGDSDTDFEMLDADANALRLIIHRTDEGDIAKLYASDRTLLQGRDERAGHFVPAAKSIFLPKDQP